MSDDGNEPIDPLAAIRHLLPDLPVEAGWQRIRSASIAGAIQREKRIAMDGYGSAVIVAFARVRGCRNDREKAFS